MPVLPSITMKTALSYIYIYRERERGSLYSLYRRGRHSLLFIGKDGFPQRRKRIPGFPDARILLYREEQRSLLSIEKRSLNCLALSSLPGRTDPGFPDPHNSKEY